MEVPITSTVAQSFGSKLIWTDHSNTKLGSLCLKGTTTYPGYYQHCIMNYQTISNMDLCRKADASNKWFKELIRNQSISKSKLPVSRICPFFHFIFSKSTSGFMTLLPCKWSSTFQTILTTPGCVLSQQLHVTTCGCQRKLWDQPLQAIHPTHPPGPNEVWKGWWILTHQNVDAHHLCTCVYTVECIKCICMLSLIIICVYNIQSEIQYIYLDIICTDMIPWTLQINKSLMF